ncbi:uncharacterized protein LOC101848835 [Aplysia californica]|uniref:Uncharacterized protein LOC101848835 n=1 Tax=Aplysia californica TaxID=6500 RepID=A0ABM0JXU4_APLCA|nr:uncharacterized protein LOC101848835 [Aplysia californica]XP_035827126.1 uncharacterized protein LOC101848835 [Aplysia californica]
MEVSVLSAEDRGNVSATLSQGCFADTGDKTTAISENCHDQNFLSLKDSCSDETSPKLQHSILCTGTLNVGQTRELKQQSGNSSRSDVTHTQNTAASCDSSAASCNGAAFESQNIPTTDMECEITELADRRSLFSSKGYVNGGDSEAHAPVSSGKTIDNCSLSFSCSNNNLSVSSSSQEPVRGQGGNITSVTAALTPDGTAKRCSHSQTHLLFPDENYASQNKTSHQRLSLTEDVSDSVSETQPKRSNSSIHSGKDPSPTNGPSQSRNVNRDSPGKCLEKTIVQPSQEAGENVEDTFGSVPDVGLLQVNSGAFRHSDNAKCSAKSNDNQQPTISSGCPTTADGADHCTKIASSSDGAEGEGRTSSKSLPSSAENCTQSSSAVGGEKNASVPSVSETVQGSQGSSGYRVLTKYVFIKALPKQRKKQKKKLGVLYKKAFRHCQGLKGSEKSKSVLKKKPKSCAGKVNGKASVNKPVSAAISTKTSPGEKIHSRTAFESQVSVSASKAVAGSQRMKRDGLSSSVFREGEVPGQNGNSARDARRLNREAKRNGSEESLNNPLRVKFKEKVAGRKSKESGKCERMKNVNARERKNMEKEKSLKGEEFSDMWTNEGPTNDVVGVAEDFESLSEAQKVHNHKDKHIKSIGNRERKRNRSRKKRKEEHRARKESERKARESMEGVVVKEENEDEACDDDGGCGGNERRVRACEDVDIGILGKKTYRKDLTLEEKVSVIRMLETPGTKVADVMHRYGISSSAINRLNRNKHFILSCSASGDMSGKQRRARECKDPELDRALLRWYRAVQAQRGSDVGFAVSNLLLKEKARDLAIAMGKTYQPRDNWIIRWKHRHNLLSKAGLIRDKEELRRFDENIDLATILEGAAAPDLTLEMLEKMKKDLDSVKQQEKREEFLICEHCGVLVSSKKKRRENTHVAGCPASAFRKDLTLEEKAQVVRALEKPGMTMVALAKKYGVSSSAISRINKNRVDILARRASGCFNSTRRRDRGSKEPEVEKVLCDWFRMQQELGIHVSGTMIRDKAKDIAKIMGKDFWPSDSWVFRWRQRNNVNTLSSFFVESEEEEDNEEKERGRSDVCEEGDVGLEVVMEPKIEWMCEGGEDTIVPAVSSKRKSEDHPEEGTMEKRARLPRSVMCEKCGFVSSRLKNNRIKALRHAKGCPDLKPRNELTYEHRAKMLKALEEPGATLSSVARQFGVSVSSMSRMNQKKEEILNHGLDHGSQKRIRDCKEPEVASQLFQWFMEKKGEGIHVTGPKLKEKARKLAAEMGREFRASSGWLGRWRQRYNIVGTSRPGGERTQRQQPAARRKKGRKSEACVEEEGEDLVEQAVLHAAMPVVGDQLSGEDSGVAGTATMVLDSLPSVPGPLQAQAQPVFLHQRFQTPWGEMAQPPPAPCLWTKEFLHSSGVSATAVVCQEETTPSFPYIESTAGLPGRTVVHSVIDSFSGMAYQVPMAVDPGGGMGGREFLKPEDDPQEKTIAMVSHIQQQIPGHALPHSAGPHIQHVSLHSHPHPPPPHTSASQPVQQSHIPTQHPPASTAHPPSHMLPSHTHTQQQQHHHQPPPQQQLQPQRPAFAPSTAPNSTTSAAVPSPDLGEEDPDQRRQVLEAFKIVSSFAQKNSLGDQVQAVLKTIEMSVKGQQVQRTDANTYTSM